MGKKKTEEIKEAVEKVSEKEASKDNRKSSDDDRIAELTDDLKRVQADFENYKKRCEKESSNFREFAKAELIKKILTIIDSFEMALKSTDNHEEFVKGVELIYSQLYSLLREEGLEHIDTKDKKFDPYKHEVMLTAPSEKDDDMILEEFQKGYTLKGLVLRHSKVKVSKNTGSKEEKE